MKDLNNHGRILAQSSGDWANYLLDGGEWRLLPTPDTSFTRLHMAYTFTYQSVEFSGWSKLDDDGSVYGTLEFLREGDPEGKDEAFWDSAPPDTMSKIVRASLPNFAIEVLGKTDDLDYDSSMEAGGNGVLATGAGVPASGGQSTANLAVFQSGVGPSLKPMAAAVTSFEVASVDSSGQISGWVNEGASSHGVIWAADGAEITSAPEHFFDSVEIPGGPVPLTPRRVIAARSALYVQKTTDGPWLKSKTESFGMYPRAITRQGWVLGEVGAGFGEFWYNGGTHDFEDIVETAPGSTCTGISLMNDSGVGIGSIYTEATNTYEEVLLLPVEIDFYKPDTSSMSEWEDVSNIQPWEELYLFSQKRRDPLKIRIKTDFLINPRIKEEICFQVSIHNGDSLTPVVWVDFHPQPSDSLSLDKTDIFCTISNESLVEKVIQQPSGKLEYASTDWSDGDPDSSFGDSDAFFAGIYLESDSAPLIDARGAGNGTETEKIDSLGMSIKPMSARATKDYLISGGSEFIQIQIGGVTVDRLCGKRAEYFFVSSHGLSRKYHDPGGHIETIDEDSGGGRVLVSPEEVEWEGMECAILNLCSVLDIGDGMGNYSRRDVNGRYPDAASDSPGKRWASSGPNVILGYNYSAPRDTPNE